MRRAKNTLFLGLASKIRIYIYCVFIFVCIQTFVHNVPYFDHYTDDDDDIHSTTWDPPEEILNDCNISKFEIIKYFLNSKPNSKIHCVSLKLDTNTRNRT